MLTWRAENHKVEIKAFDKREKEHNTNPCLTFEEAFGRFPDILSHLSNQTFTKPTPIQSQLWPIALQGRDCIGISQTGSGKTLAFLAPLIAHAKYGGILTSQDDNRKEYEEPAQQQAMPLPDTTNKKPVCEGGPLALILAPLRELAEQIENQISKIFHGLHISDLERDGSDGDRLLRSLVMVGGKDRNFQIRTLQDSNQFPHIVVGTPGRIIDLAFSNNDLDLSNVSFVVIDEADRMLDMGFQPQITKILEKCKVPRNRQMIMTSATWPVEIQKLARSFLNKPIIVRVGEFDLKCVETVEQNVIRVTQDPEKFQILLKQINDLRAPKEEPESEDSDDADDNNNDDVIAAEEEIYVQPNDPPADNIQPEAEEVGWGNSDNDEDNDDDNINGWDAVEPNNIINAAPAPRFIDQVYKCEFKMIVFCSMKVTVDEVYSNLRASCASLGRILCKMHGDHDQV